MTRDDEMPTLQPCDVREIRAAIEELKRTAENYQKEADLALARGGEAHRCACELERQFKLVVARARARATEGAELVRARAAD